MPILVGDAIVVPAPDEPGPVGPVVPQRRTITLVGLRDAVMLTDRLNGYRVPREGVRGLGLPPVDVQRKNGAGVGSRYLRTRLEERVIDITVEVSALDPEVFNARVKRLLDLLDDRNGPVTIEVGNGLGGSRRIAAYLTGGASDWTSGFQGSTTRLLLPLSFVCPDPYFVGDEVIGDSISTDAGKPFIPFGAPLITAPSVVLGELALFNPGDAPAPLVWTITGPGGPITVKSVTDGFGFTVEATLAAGESRYVDTDAKTMVDDDGNDRYAEFGPAPVLWSLPPGQSAAVVSMTSAKPGSSIAYEGMARWRTATA